MQGFCYSTTRGTRACFAYAREKKAIGGPVVCEEDCNYIDASAWYEFCLMDERFIA
ncbi:hypothetical protein [Anaplasma phagocytophilum]|uniref:Uncharacterized protein n=5 Tax=Anaplasma phagocytophilum TaxID=948 RepID=A0A098GMA1_ANAPH|nr:hypothetical protein [Anaplasma phagocytophilum]KJV67294.1 hypothetical protein APHNP_0652 [Anaplasma phagocytophilum str. ApNP]KJV85110.1 hypothetical protein APHWI1_0620 [Anaplasma phagocytophilum str. ApWI1]KJZ99278.1 hypothetical protein APHCR_0598 [Anaplasma phagocytophilum str. CR1007]ABD43268.1 hypothetical protein APH_1083 [Anaplasma phagocytophilum str. HZ]AGR79629.1 hypothetical protein YYU_04975 [Anaplasma phagocytophilum str. HZ2]